MKLAEIQSALREMRLDGWLMIDFRGSDPIAVSVLGLPVKAHRSRRWAYFIPADGEPMKLNHRIEPAALAGLPGRAVLYSQWREWEAALGAALAGRRRVAMQYSPRNGIPYVARADAGSVELVRSFGVEPVSSGDLIAKFEATMDDAQWRAHHEAADRLGALMMEAFAEIGRRIRAGRPTDESAMQAFLLDNFRAGGLVSDHAPNVSVDANAADPHYDPPATGSAVIKPGSLVLIDAWCRLDRPDGIYADITWMGWVGDRPPAEVVKVFDVVLAARDAAWEVARAGWERTLAGRPGITLPDGTSRPLQGRDIDDAARKVIVDAGYGEWYPHRTGHSIHRATHGNGANMDNFETCDDRRLLPRTCFSIEPGIYFPGRFGVRSEINVCLPPDGPAEITGLPVQRELILVG